MQELFKEFDERIKNCESMLNFLMSKQYLYNNIFEINFIIKHFSQLNESDIKDKYLKLISNLDSESVKTVQLIINRCRTILNLKRGNIDFFSEKEKFLLSKVEKDFENCVVKLSNEVLAYKNYLLPIANLETNVFFYDCMIHEFDDISDLSSRSIVDVGGFIGDSALVLSKYTNMPLYVFEPDENNYSLLQKTIEMNKLNNIVAEKSVLGDCISEVSLSNNASMSMVGEFADGFKVKQITLDSYVKENDINVGLIKVDIEGYEKQFLLGAKETIISHKPKLLVSIYHNFEQFFEIKPMLEQWGLNYKFKVVKPVDGSVLLETVLVGEPL